MSSFRLFLLGAPRLERDGEPLKLYPRKNVALVAFLAMAALDPGADWPRGARYTREALVTLLWPELEPSRGRAGLRRNLSLLRKTFDGAWLLADRETVSTDPSADLWIDVEQFLRLLRAWQEHGHLQDHVCAECLPALVQAEGLYGGDFLAGFSLRDSPAFDDWQFFQTESLRRELASGLQRLVAGHTAQCEYDLAIPHARRWLSLDPLHEPAHRHLMRLYAWSDQYAAALRQYGECVRVLEEELGVPPEDETRKLAEAIREKRLAPPAAVHAPPGTSDETTLNNRYRLGTEIGRGGMGVVYRAHDLLLQRDVAVKVLPGAAPGSEGRARLLNEARATVRLDHPNIVTVYDAGEAKGSPFIVMQLVEGETLHQRRPETLEETLAIARQVCAALEHAHGQGIIHRDLKPENVLVTADGTAKLGDFGLARPVASRVTSEGTIAGTAFYLAPELALGQACDGRVDLYALGVMLYELTTGSLPFAGEDPLVVISQHLHAPVIPPRARTPSIPPRLDALIVRLLSKDPQNRPDTATEVRQALESDDILDREAAPAGEPSLLRRIGRGRLVGRERELGEARALWSQTLASQGQVLLISGEPGIGKTRLVREMATQVQVSGGQALVSGCYAEGGVPYAPFAQILRRLLEPGGDGDLDLPEFVLADLVALAPALRLHYPDVEPEPAIHDPQMEQHRLFENLTIFFSALSSRAPLLLAVEDLHWADSGTLALLRHLARQTGRGRMMIVATYRDVEAEEAQRLDELWLDLRRERLARHLKLPRLDRDQTREMLAALFASDITPEFLEGVWRETEGNPFFVEEVVRALVESGKLTFEDGRWQRPSTDELGIPRSIQVAIRSRLRVLPEDVQETLCLAAVLGREFDFETLAQANASFCVPSQTRGEGALLEALETAEQAQLIEEVSTEGGGTFAFAHGLIPAALLEGTRTLQRRRLHLCAAAAIEAQRPDDLEALAHHCRQGGQTEKATDYLLQAGDRARALYAHQEAIDDYRQALTYLRKADDRVRAARTVMKLGLTYQNAFDYKAARQAYQEGFALWQQAAEIDSSAAPPPAPHALRVTALEPATLISYLAPDQPSVMAICQLFSGLLEVGPDMGVVPDVAHSWEMVDEGRRYIFHLRDDVAWSDGVQVTASDFEYGWRMLLDPTKGHQWARYLYHVRGARAYHQGRLTDPDELGIHVLDERTLSVDLVRPTSYFPNLLTTMDAFPAPRHVVEKHGTSWTQPGKIVSNGAFLLAALEWGEGMAFERNPTYHGRFAGNIQRVECSFLTGPPAKFLQKYDEDDLDICGDLPPKDMSRARLRHAGEYVAGPRLQTSFLCLDANRPPFDDRRVRRAFALATNKEALADVALEGYAFPATGGLVPPGMPGHSPGIGLPYDPECARRLLAEAGYPGGRGFPDIECLARDDPGHDLLCKHVAAEWRETLGVETTWHEIGWGRFYDTMVQATPHMWLAGWVADYPDPDNFLRVQWWSALGWRDEAYDRLVEQAGQVLDQEERMAMYRQADRILVEDAPVLPMTYGRFHMLVKPWVGRYRTSPLHWWFWKDIILEAH